MFSQLCMADISLSFLLFTHLLKVYVLFKVSAVKKNLPHYTGHHPFLLSLMLRCQHPCTPLHSRGKKKTLVLRREELSGCRAVPCRNKFAIGFSIHYQTHAINSVSNLNPKGQSLVTPRLRFQTLVPSPPPPPPPHTHK